MYHFQHRGTPNFRRGGHSWRSRNAGSMAHAPKTPSPPRGRLYEAITRRDMTEATEIVSHENDDHPSRITGCRCMTSFNWVQRDSPTIIVPGSPPAWTPAAEPRQLPRDQERLGDFKYYRDQNAARFPSHPLEPAVRALFSVRATDFESSTIDIFACSSTLGSLLCFARRDEKPFRFFVEVIGNTVFFERHERSPTEVIDDIHGYGHSFPAAYTRWGPSLQDSKSHQRLLQYNFAGLSCVVRYECDGHLKSAADGNEQAIEPITTGALRIEEGGRLIAQRNVFDLKTRAGWKKDGDILEGQLHRCWVSQTPNFILAFHERGVFDDIQVHDIQESVQLWEEEHQTEIKRFHWLLTKIISSAMEHMPDVLEICYKSPDEIEIRGAAVDDHHLLPTDLVDRWAQGDQKDSAASSSLGSLGQSEKDEDRIVGSGDEDSGSLSGSDLDYTACSAEDCGYCGRCSY